MLRTVAKSTILLASWLAAVSAATPHSRTAAPPGTVFDFSAIDRLWAIVSSLERDQEPAAETWDALVGTPGYAALIARERGYGLDFLQRNLRLVFKPSMAVNLEQAPRSPSLRHFLALKEKRAELQAFQASVQRSGVAAEGLELARAWLPGDTLGRVRPPAVCFVVFAPDARGGYGPLIFDLVYALGQGDRFKFLYAHEAFHYYRRERPFHDPGQVRLGYQRVLEALNKVQDEGIADQIDKAEVIEAGGEPASAYDRDYRKALADTPRVLATLDELLCRLRESPREAVRLGNQMNAAIPMSGHPTGHFMARAALAHAGRAELVRTFNNPLAFFCLYNAAALADPALPRLSNAAISALGLVAREVGAPLEALLARAALHEGLDAAALGHLAAVTERLAADQEPDRALWEALFGSPGARLFFAREGDTREALQHAIQLAFRPSRAAELTAALEGSSRVVRYFADYRQHAATVAGGWDAWQRSGAFARSLEQAWPYFPRDARERLAGTSLVLTYLGSADVRYGYELLLVDPSLIRQKSAEELASFLRLHLLWRYKDAVRPYDPTTTTRRQAAFLDTWELVQHRGLWDLMRRDLGDPETPEARKRYDARFQEAAALLRRADAIMVRASTDNAVWAEFEDLQRDLYVGQGCPLGYFMATTARSVLGQEALAATTGHPVAFVALYQKAARARGGLPLFSERSVALLARLERDAIAGAPTTGTTE